MFVLRALVLLDVGVGLLLEVCHRLGQRLERVHNLSEVQMRLGREGCWILILVQKCLDFDIAEEGMQRGCEGSCLACLRALR